MLWITLKHSSRRLLCFFCILLLGAALAVAAQGGGEQTTPQVTIGVVNMDEDDTAAAALSMLGGVKELSGLFKLTVVTPEQAAGGGYTAVLTIPEGFTQSVLTGENKAPSVLLSASSPLEAMLARQMAEAGARYLTSAQLGIYAVLGRVPETLSAQERDAIVLRANLAFAGQFLNRYMYLETQELSAAGAMTLKEHYTCAVPAVLLLCCAFLFAPAVLGARRFGRRVRGAAVWWAVLAHIALLFAAAVLLPAALLGGLNVRGTLALLVLALLVASFAMLVCSLFQSEVLCTAASLLLGLGTGLLSGCIVPPALLPPSLEAAAALLPAGQALALLAVPVAGAATPFLPALLMAAGFLALSALLWRFGGTEGRARA